MVETPMKRQTNCEARSEPCPVVGLAAGTIEMGAGQEFRVRMTTGELVRAHLAPGVDPALAMECISMKRMVILAGTGAEPLILGALQTGITPQLDSNGDLHLRGRHVRLDADDKLELRAGPTGEGQASLHLDKGGKIRIRGERMMMNVTASLRVHSALVELP